MTQEEYDIQVQVDSLMQKVLETWKREGKWDGNNPNSPFYGFEKDPLLRILITAFVYQTNGLKNDIQNLERNVVSDFQNSILPYHITQAMPAMTLIQTAKNSEEPGDVYCDDSTAFLVKKESLRVKEMFPFHPLFRTKIIGMTVNGITKIASDKWNVNIDVADQKADLSNFGFLVTGLRYSDVNVYWNNEKLPLIRPWEFDRFPKMAWFNDANIVFNKSMLFGGESKWHDLWAQMNVNYYMVAPTFRRPLDSDMINFVFEFSGMSKPFNFETENLMFNCFPAVNVMKKDFQLSSNEPILKLTNETDYSDEDTDAVKGVRSSYDDNNHEDFFLNLVMNPDSSIDDLDRFSIRRFGCERFNLNALVQLADELSKRYESDFYAFQKVHKMQNTDKIRRLDIVLKDVFGVILNNKEPRSGVYAILKHGKGDGNPTPIHLTGLFTDGAYANDIDIFSDVSGPKSFDKKETRMLFKTFGGRDEVVDKDEKNMLAKYYARTNDRIVTRADLKAFCYRYFAQNGIADALLDVISVIERQENGMAKQHVTIQLKNDFVRDREDVPMLVERLRKLIEVRSANVIPIVVDYLAVVS
ncbi:MAG: hypothetical protein IKM99_04470 [Bacteroidales bacterium]|nr:hypothetical protein [Bacteroidales bacterium]